MVPCQLHLRSKIDNSKRGLMRQRILTITVLIVLILAISPAQKVLSATVIVTSTADNGSGTLRNAIAAASSGDTITFDPTIFSTPKTITLTSGKLVIDKNLNIKGPGANFLAIDGNSATVIFAINPDETDAGIYTQVVISGVTIQHGKGYTDAVGNSRGGGIFNYGMLTVSNSIFIGNSTSSTCSHCTG